jgi:glucose/arabinose dehydrogenase
VTTTLSPPVQIFAVLGVIGALGFAAFTFLSSGEASVATPAPVTPVERTAPTTPSPTPTRNSPTPTQARAVETTTTASGFPRPINQALGKRRVVVVMVYMPGASVDRLVRADAKAAARATGAGFVALSALNERMMGSLVSKTGVLPDPAVLVVRRPGVVATTLSVSDRLSISQAVAQARK